MPRFRLLQLVIALVLLLLTSALTFALDGQTRAIPHRTDSLSKNQVASVTETVAAKDAAMVEY